MKPAWREPPTDRRALATGGGGASRDRQTDHVRGASISRDPFSAPAGNDNGGRTAATLFSLIATCQRHEVEPMAYLRDVLNRIAATPISRLPELLPNRWHPAPTD